MALARERGYAKIPYLHHAVKTSPAVAKEGRPYVGVRKPENVNERSSVDY